MSIMFSTSDTQVLTSFILFSRHVLPFHCLNLSSIVQSDSQQLLQLTLKVFLTFYPDLILAELFYIVPLHSAMKIFKV